MGSRAERIGLRVAGLIDFLGKKLLVPAERDGVHLSTRVNLNCHELHTILHVKLEPGVERDLAIRHSLSQQGTFGLSQGFNAV